MERRYSFTDYVDVAVEYVNTYNGKYKIITTDVYWQHPYEESIRYKEETIYQVAVYDDYDNKDGEYYIVGMCSSLEEVKKFIKNFSKSY